MRTMWLPNTLRWQRRVGVMLCAACAGTFGVAGPTRAAGGTAAASANDFLNSLGVCTHISQGADNYQQVIAALQYTGIREIRDDASSGALNTFISIHNQTGARVVMTWSGPNQSDISLDLNWDKTLANAGALLALEGPNEPNNWAVTYNGVTSHDPKSSHPTNTSLPIGQWQADFYSQAKADPVLKDYPVFASSEAGGSELDNVGLQYLTIPQGAGTLMPAGTTFADYANVHNYFPGGRTISNNQAWNNASPYNYSGVDGMYVEYGHTWWSPGYNGYSTAQLATLPKVTTETGWATGRRNLTEDQQGKLYLNMYLDQFKQGFSYTFTYMMHDDGSGLSIYNSDWTAKQSAVYLHNLTTILADDGSTSPDSALDYTIANEPVTVHDLLLQKSDGTFMLAVWDEEASGSDSITVDLGQTIGSLNIYDPTLGTDPIQTLTDVSSVPLTLSDHPLILEIPDLPATVPEPASLGLLALGGLALLTRRRT